MIWEKVNFFTVIEFWVSELKQVLVISYSKSYSFSIVIILMCSVVDSVIYIC